MPFKRSVSTTNDPKKRSLDGREKNWPYIPSCYRINSVPVLFPVGTHGNGKEKENGRVPDTETAWCRLTGWRLFSRNRLSVLQWSLSAERLNRATQEFFYVVHSKNVRKILTKSDKWPPFYQLCRINARVYLSDDNSEEFSIQDNYSTSLYSLCTVSLSSIHSRLRPLQIYSSDFSYNHPNIYLEV